MRDVVVATQDDALLLGNDLAYRRIVGAREREPSRPRDAVEQLTDNSAVRHDDDALIRMCGDDALKPSPDPRVELVVRLGSGDDVPTFLHEDLLEDRVAPGRAAPELALFPVAEEHLAQVGLFDRCQPGACGERRGGLVRSLERRDVDRGDGFVLQALREELGLLHADRVERGVAVTVAGRERAIGMRRRRLAVTDEEHGRGAGRRREAVLAKAFRRYLGFWDLGFGGRHEREVSAR